MVFKQDPTQSFGAKQLTKLAIIAVVAGAIIYAIFHFTASSNRSDTLPDTALTYNAVDNPQISAWVAKVAPDILTLTPQNADANLAASKKYFTDDGWNVFAQALKDSGIVDVVKQSGITYTIKLTGASLVERAGSATAEMPPTWHVTTPAELITLPEGRMSRSRVRLMLKIVDTNAISGHGGYKIVQWVTLPEKLPYGIQ